MARKKTSIEREWERQQEGGQGRGSFCYLANSDQEPYRVFAVEQDPPPHRRARRFRISYPVARLWSDGTKEMAKWTPADLITYMQGPLRKIANSYGGTYVLDVQFREPVRDPIEPLFRRAPQPQMQGVPREAPPKTTATKEDLDRLDQQTGDPWES